MRIVRCESDDKVRSRGASEAGQAVVEFGLVLVLIVTMTAGLIDAGLGIYNYNVVSSLARYGARWAAVVGGTCAQIGASSTSDFCVQNGTTTNSFWAQPGNVPIQGPGVSCPSYASTPADYYSVGSYLGANGTTIAGAVAQHFDSSSSSKGFLNGSIAPGFNLAKLKVCIALSSTNSTPLQGDWVTVSVYYPFQPALQLLTKQTFSLSATSTYEVE